MFQALKRLFRREERPAAPTQTASPTPQPEAPATTPKRPKAPGPSVFRKTPAPPKPETPASPPPSPPSAPAAETGQELVVRIPLKSILNRLPAALKDRVRQAGSANIQAAFPIQSLVSQLATGRVQVTFGQLRRALPAGVISGGPDQDSVSFELPLPDVLAQIPPQLLPRRQAQTMVHVPDEVAPVFGKQGGDIKVLSKESTKAAPAPPAKQPTARLPLTAEPKLPATPVKSPYRETPKPPAPAPKPPPAAPAPTGGPIRMKTEDLEALTRAKATPVKAPEPPAKSTAPPPPAPKPVAAAPKPPPPAAPPPPAQAPTAKGSINLPLHQVFDALPDAVKRSLAQAKSQNAVFVLPAAEIERGLKIGKVTFDWKTLRSLLQPSPISSSTPSADQLTVELPLPIVAPLFLASHKPATQKKKIDIAQDIPDVFENRRAAAEASAPVAPPPTPAPAAPTPTRETKPEPAPSAPTPKTEPRPAAPAPPPVATPPPAKPAPAPAPAPIPVPAAPPPQPIRAAAAAQEIGELFGQPGRKNWTPAEIAQKTTLLEGVGGALIVLQDGLLVAAKLPPGLDGDTIAAFLPQMYGRMSQYCKELRLGDPKKITFVIDEMPLSVYRGAGVYFAVLGRAGEDLPQAKLEVIAAQLGSQSNA